MIELTNIDTIFFLIGLIFMLFAVVFYSISHSTIYHHCIDSYHLPTMLIGIAVWIVGIMYKITTLC